jgi:choline dehydrogenase
MKMAISLGTSDAFKKRLNSTPVYPFADGIAPAVDKNSDEFLEWWARSLAGTLYHPVGTCKMGRETDEARDIREFLFIRQDAVVNPRLKVKGISKLRIVDASVMPHLPSGNTNAPSIMIGEKAADMIKEDHGLKSN